MRKSPRDFTSDSGYDRRSTIADARVEYGDSLVEHAVCRPRTVGMWRMDPVDPSWRGADSGGHEYQAVTVNPQRYFIELKLDPRVTTFSGEVQIDANVVERVDRIVLHGENFSSPRSWLNLHWAP